VAILAPPPMMNQHSTNSVIMPGSVPPAVVVSLQGMEGTGKTYTAFTSPGPIGYINLDDGWQRVRPHFPDKDIFMTTIDSPDIPEGADPATVQRLYAPVYTQFKQAFSLYLGTCRTVVVDTMTSAWALARLAYLGTQGGVKGKQYAYSPVNDDFRRLIRLRRKAPLTSVILIHREKAEWVGDAKTGRFEMAGFTEMPFEVDDLLGTGLDSNGQFYVKMLKSKTRPSLTGKVYPAPDNTFVNIAVDLFPQTLPTDWL
jgi:hypothetical protein